jgi:hypothetical protein
MPGINTEGDNGCNIESVCLAMLRVAGETIKPPAKSALSAVTNFVACETDDWEEIEAMAEEDGVTAWEFVRTEVESYIGCDTFSADILTLRRMIRVTCRPEEVTTSGRAAVIGVSWSLSSDLSNPTFLDQYGEPGGRIVSFEAEVRHDDVNWLATIWKAIDPRVSDYREVVLLPHSVPKILSVSDPEVCAVIPVVAETQSHSE